MAPPRRKTALDLDRARKQLTWVDEDDLDELEPRSTLGATLLGLFTWGGGRFMVGDRRGGALGLAALVGWIALSPVVPAAIGAAVYWAGGAAFAYWAHDSSRRVHRFDAIRTQLALQAGPPPDAYRLLAAASAVDPSLASALPAPPDPPAPGPHADLVAQLRRLAALHHAGVLDDGELADRKLDLFSTAAPTSRAELDDLLFALLPLRDDGIVSDEDVAFLKGITAG